MSQANLSGVISCESGPEYTAHTLSACQGELGG